MQQMLSNMMQMQQMASAANIQQQMMRQLPQMMSTFMDWWQSQQSWANKQSVAQYPTAPMSYAPGEDFHSM